VARGGEAAHVQPDLGDDHRGGDRADAGDLIEAGRCLDERGDHLLDRGVELGDVGVEGVDGGDPEPLTHAE
jgi:hypothetical protein